MLECSEASGVGIIQLRRLIYGVVSRFPFITGVKYALTLHGHSQEHFQGILIAQPRQEYNQIGMMKNILNRMKYVRNNQGWRSLAGLIFTFFSQRVLIHGRYYLQEYHIPEKIEGNYLPRLTEYSCQIVSTIEEADKLVSRGFDFYSTAINSRERLKKGAIACCVLVGKDIAHIGWMALNEEAKNTWNPFPYRVDFQHAEACSGGAVTLPKYEGKGLMTYGLYRRLEFLQGKGIIRSHTITVVSNAASLKVQSRFSYKIYARVHYLKILGWHYWKETPQSI
jgi:hypothetical protein